MAIPGCRRAGDCCVLGCRLVMILFCQAGALGPELLGTGIAMPTVDAVCVDVSQVGMREFQSCGWLLGQRGQVVCDVRLASRSARRQPAVPPATGRVSEMRGCCHPSPRAALRCRSARHAPAVKLPWVLLPPPPLRPPAHKRAGPVHLRVPARSRRGCLAPGTARVLAGNRWGPATVDCT